MGISVVKGNRMKMKLQFIQNTTTHKFTSNSSSEIRNLLLAIAYYDRHEKNQRQNEDKINFKSNHQRCSVKKEVFKNFTNFTVKTLALESLFNKVTSLGL